MLCELQTLKTSNAPLPYFYSTLNNYLIIKIKTVRSNNKLYRVASITCNVVPKTLKHKSISLPS